MSSENSSTLQAAPAIGRYAMPFTRIELALLSVDENELVVLLGKRSEAPHKGRWALPGGVLRIDMDPNLDAAALRVGRERLGLELRHLHQLEATGSSSRDPRAPWALSISYRALVPRDAIEPVVGKRLDAVKWVSVHQAEADSGLAFDHAELVRHAAQAARDEIDRLELPYDFLPDRFTLGELQACCESILGRRLDKSSFRRRLEDRALLEAVAGEMRTGPFRPAQLYRRPRDSRD